MRSPAPKPLPTTRQAAVLSRVLETSVRFIGLSDQDARTGMLQRGLPEFYADALIEVSQAYRDGGVDTITSTVRDLTGRDLNTFERFVREQRAAFV